MCLIISTRSKPSCPGGYTPAGGSHPSWTAKTSWKITAETNGGMPPTKNAVVLTKRVEPAAGLAAGEDAHADADADAEHGGGAGEAERVEERIPQRLPHLAVALDALRPGVWALQELAEPLEVAPDVAPEARVQAVVLDELVDLGLAGARVGSGIRGDRVQADPAGDVHEERHDEDRRDHPQQSPDNESRHSLPPSGEFLEMRPGHPKGGMPRSHYVTSEVLTRQPT